jgi:hypothetical protein
VCFVEAERQDLKFERNDTLLVVPLFEEGAD